MKKGQTSVRGGIQDLLCPVVDVNITQGSNGSYSHKGSTAIDNASGKDKNLYAPCDCTCVAIDKQYAFVCWQSDNKVRFADGTIDYATFYFGHDSNINAKVGMKVKQGVLIAQEGTGGVATGVHSHIEVAKGKYTGVLWKPNTYGVYVLPNAVEFEVAFFMDETTITVGKANWKYLKDVSVSTSSTSNTSTNFGGTYKVMADTLNVRDKASTSGKVMDQYKKGQIVNLENTYYIADGYVWGTYVSSSGVRRYIAVGKNTGKAESDDYLVKM